MHAEGVYLVDDSGMAEMALTPYDTEAELQELLATHPSLLAGRQVDRSTPRRFLLIAREQGLPASDVAPDRFAVDHLFVDQVGVPTLVEVKRSSNTQVRRQVVGQLLDYAANGIRYWPVDRLRSDLVIRLGGETAAEQHVSKFLAEAGELEPDVESFWDAVNQNLRTGRLRLIFVADEIPDTLRRIIEFLNEQLVRCEVLGLEVRQYCDGDRRVLVPTLVGQTIHAQEVKRAESGPAFDELMTVASVATVEIERRLSDLAQKNVWKVTTSRAGRQYRLPSGTTLFQLNAKAQTVQMSLGSLLDAGLGAETQDLRDTLGEIAGRPVTARNPWVDAQNLMDRWDQWTHWIRSYVDAHSQIAATQPS